MAGWHRGFVLLLVCGAVAVCSKGPTAPSDVEYTITVRAGDAQYALPGDPVAEPLEVQVTDRRTGDPVSGVTVHWRVALGSGAELTHTRSSSDARGIASTRLRLGGRTGNYEVHANLDPVADDIVSFEAWAVQRPVVRSVHPSRPSAGDTVRIEGEHLAVGPRAPVVSFAGIGGTLISGDSTSLRVVVPRCLPSRTVDVEVWLGAIGSDAASIRIDGDPAEPVVLDVGDVRSFATPEALGCLQLDGEADHGYLVVLHNTASQPSASLPYRLIALSTAEPTVETLVPAPRMDGPPVSPADAWEQRIRMLERGLPWDEFRERGERGEHERRFGILAAPRPGSRRDFQVYNKDGEFTRVTAEVRHVSDHAIFYVDQRAPAGGLTDEDLEYFGRLLDDPIHTTLAPVFGEPSDIDDNGRVIILFTPVVNELTPRGSGSGSFVAGYFYGCDLLPRDKCEHSNEAEVFYSLVPDPSGVHGNVRRLQDVRAAVPPVLAHEYQHMIHYNERVRMRGGRQEVLWLSEALAHMAEDLIHEELRRRGEYGAAQPFLDSNRARAVRFLQNPGAVSLITDEAPGTVAERGAQWLFLKYLTGHYGGDELLQRLTRTTMASIENVEAKTERGWDELMREWTVALWADGLKGVPGIPLDPVYTFPDTHLRNLLSAGGSYPLVPTPLDFEDALLAGTLPASGARFLALYSPRSGAPPLHLAFTRHPGRSSEQARPGVSVMRIR